MRVSRVNLLAVLAAALVLCVSAGGTRADGDPMRGPWKTSGQTPGSTKEAEGGSGLLGFYRNHLSPVDGDRCPMVPGCSAYAGECARKHGAFAGWIMACDRLMRCGRDELRLSPNVWTVKGRRCLDTVSANDFWWFRARSQE
jgi:putative component of membrane protein insertase Oxa1/YidC/SpoIIIJ protein YidD